MAKPTTPLISSRKSPRQGRSERTVADILAAAVQVLAKEGAHRFTTARVAERAGVSIGSLYQYFPNKAAILFRLQSDEWRQTSTTLRSILADRAMPPLERIRVLVDMFVRSECEEVEVRRALNDAAPFYRDAPEARESRGSGPNAMRDFMAEALPSASAATCDLAASIVSMALGSVGKSISERHREPEVAALHAGALADMMCSYLASLGAGAAGHDHPAAPPAVTLRRQQAAE